MGTADLVPGVSGGTIALVLGIYRRLVASIRLGSAALGRFVRADLRGGVERLRQVEWGFLVPLLAGIALAVLTLAGFIGDQLDSHPTEMAAIFFGLVAASIVAAWGLLETRDAQRLAILAVTAVVTFIVLGFRSGPVEDPGLLLYAGAGAIAINAMILPGISGSFMLLMLGMYEAVLDAVDQRDLVVLGAFAVGAIVGLALFSSLLHWLLENHYDTVMAALIGLMAGSLRVLWPWPDGTESTELAWPAASDALVPILLAGAAAAVVTGIVALGRRSEQVPA